MSRRIRTLLLDANGTHWVAICLDTLSHGLRTRASTPTWAARSPHLRRLFGDRYAQASYMADWREAFEASPRLDVKRCNITDLLEFRASRPDIRDFDLVVVLHSAAGDRMSVLTHTASWFQGRRGKLAMFVGNEYDLLEEKIAFARTAGADYICSQLPMPTARPLYADTRAVVVSMPHALNPRVYFSRPGVERRIDVGFVGDLYERLIGDRERTDIVQFFSRQGAAQGLRCDIRTTRMPREDWAEFLSACRCVAGAESGTYYLQRNGAALNCAKQYVKRHPDASFEAVHRACFEGQPSTLNGKALSSRHMEPIGTRTCQVLVEGFYNGILRADEHYIAVKRDLSNIDEAVRRLKDRGHREQVAQAAYDHAINAHTYDHRVERLLDVIAESPDDLAAAGRRAGEASEGSACAASPGS